MFATFAKGRRKERHHCMKSKSIGEGRFITLVKVASGNGRSIEREAHVRQARADELCVDSRIVRQRRTKRNVVVIKLLGEEVLKFESLDGRAKDPER